MLCKRVWLCRTLHNQVKESGWTAKESNSWCGTIATAKKSTSTQSGNQRSPQARTPALIWLSRTPKTIVSFRRSCRGRSWSMRLMHEMHRLNGNRWLSLRVYLLLCSKVRRGQTVVLGTNQHLRSSISVLLLGKERTWHNTHRFGRGCNILDRWNTTLPMDKTHHNHHCKWGRCKAICKTHQVRSQEPS